MAIASAVSLEKKIPVYIRYMTTPDIPKVLEIEKKSFEFPWVEKEFRRFLKQKNRDFDCRGLVAIHQKAIVGFMVYESYKTRICLLDFAVHPDFRRKRIGAQMAVQLINELRPQRKTKIFVEVRETNLPAQLFFQKMGFKAICIVRGFYQNCPEDIYLMQYSIEGDPAFLRNENRISSFFS